MTTHTSRTLKYLRDLDFHAEVIERWVINPKHPAGGFRKDYFGFGDILAFNHDGHRDQTLLVQSCGSGFSEHRRKMLEIDEIMAWTISPTRRVLLISWRKVKKKRGGKAMIWKPRIAEFWAYHGRVTCHEYLTETIL